MSSMRKIEANRRNAQLSTGPITAEGKAIARGNAYRDGLSGEGVVQPADEREKLRQRREEWAGSFGKGTESKVGQWLLDLVVLESVRIDRCARQEIELIAQQSQRAVSNWDEDRRAEAEALGAKLARTKHPSWIVSKLRATTQGYDWLIDRWSELKKVSDQGQLWSDAQRRMAQNLKGIPPVFRDLPRLLTLEQQAEAAATELDELYDHQQRAMNTLDAMDQKIAAMGLALGVDYFRLQKYAARSHRRLEWALGHIVLNKFPDMTKAPHGLVFLNEPDDQPRSLPFSPPTPTPTAPAPAPAPAPRPPRSSPGPHRYPARPPLPEPSDPHPRQSPRPRPRPRLHPHRHPRPGPRRRHRPPSRRGPRPRAIRVAKRSQRQLVTVVPVRLVPRAGCPACPAPARPRRLRNGWNEVPAPRSSPSSGRRLVRSRSLRALRGANFGPSFTRRFILAE